MLHNAARIGDPQATWGVVEGNPVHDDIRAAAAAAPPHFAFDVILNREQRVIEAFAGELDPMHRAACEAARKLAMVEVPEPFDVVVTSNSGYPLDQNLYQAVKGMSAAAKVVKPGGLIVCAAECRDGFPGHGSYRQLLESSASPREFLRTIAQSDHVTPDQWQVQIQANIQDHARVVMHTEHLSDDELRSVHLEQTRDIAATVAAEGAERPRLRPARGPADDRLRRLSPSVRARQAEHVLADVGEHQVVVDRRDLVQPRLAELALDVVLAGEAVAAVGVQAGVGRLPGRPRRPAAWPCSPRRRRARRRRTAQAAW